MTNSAVSTMSEPSAGARSAVPPVAAVAWLAFAALALGQLLVDIDDVVLNIALPSIAVDVDMTPAQMPWAINAYLLCFGGLLLLGGRLADRWGHRTALLTGVVAFVTSSLLGTLAQSSTAVITARAGQGLAGGRLGRAPGGGGGAACAGGDEPAGAHLSRPGPALPCLGAVGGGDRARRGGRAGRGRSGHRTSRLAVDLQRQRCGGHRRWSLGAWAAARRHR